MFRSRESPRSASQSEIYLTGSCLEVVMGFGHIHTHQDHSRESHTDHALIDRGMWAVKWSFLAMLATAIFQLLLVFVTGSVALLADTIHNLGDAITALPLAIAFRFGKKKPSKRFTYGFGRVEDLAGLVVLAVILISAVIIAYESVNRLVHPQPVQHLWIVVIASIIGFAGNEAVAWFRIKVGKKIGSGALIADGYHARADGFTSLAVLGGAIGVWLGFPLADPLIGILITLAILKILWDSGKEVFTRILDGIDPEVVEDIREIASKTPQVKDVSEVRVRWLGHRMHAEINIAVAPKISVEKAHTISMALRKRLLDHLHYLSGVTIHIDPQDASGEKYHELLSK
ncbi:cation transporter [Candidatus Woesearchaeota archaeon]|nr:cation transporter [Candidatus Woesearchaeota archaeon]